MRENTGSEKTDQFVSIPVLLVDERAPVTGQKVFSFDLFPRKSYLKTVVKNERNYFVNYFKLSKGHKH